MWTVERSEYLRPEKNNTYPSIILLHLEMKCIEILEIEKFTVYNTGMQPPRQRPSDNPKAHRSVRFPARIKKAGKRDIP